MIWQRLIPPIAIALLAFTGCDSTNDLTSNSNEPPASPNGSEAKETDDGGGHKAETWWERAEAMTGEVAFVCGPLISVRSTDDATFLNVGRDHPDPQRFTIVIWQPVGDLEFATETKVCARGEVQSFEGGPQIQYRTRAEFEDGVKIAVATSDPTSSSDSNTGPCHAAAAPLMRDLKYLRHAKQLTLTEYTELVTWLTYTAEDTNPLIEAECRSYVAPQLLSMVDDHLRVLDRLRACSPGCPEIEFPNHRWALAGARMVIRISDSRDGKP